MVLGQNYEVRRRRYLPLLYHNYETSNYTGVTRDLCHLIASSENKSGSSTKWASKKLKPYCKVQSWRHKNNKHLSWRQRTNTFQRLKMTVLWNVAPCSLVEVYRRFRGGYYPHHRPDDGGSKHPWNVGRRIPDYKAQHPRRQLSSYSLPWEPEISPIQRLIKIIYPYAPRCKGDIEYLTVDVKTWWLCKNITKNQFLKEVMA
jgi:hypothetical protein